MAGKGSKMQPQPVALERAAGGQPEGKGLAQLLGRVGKQGRPGQAGPEAGPCIRGLAGEEAVGKVKRPWSCNTRCSKICCLQPCTA